MIVLDQVQKRYSHPEDNSWFDAVLPTSLTIEQGEIFGLIGFWVLLNSLDINIFTTSKVTTLATQLESELVDSILKRVYK